MSLPHPQTLILLASAALNLTPPSSQKAQSEPPQDSNTPSSTEQGRGYTQEYRQDYAQEYRQDYRQEYGQYNGASTSTGQGQGSISRAEEGESSTKPRTKPRSESLHRCTNAGCNKVYKQYNGLKYHQAKGQCDYTVRDAQMLGLSAQEVEDARRPHVCIGGDGCTKRYRQRNGLKYHYQHSGQHGQLGLQMLRDGSHPMPMDGPADPLGTMSP